MSGILGFLKLPDITSAINVFLRIGGQLLLLPVLLRSTSVEDMGLWYVFAAITSISFVFEVLLSGSAARLAAAYSAGMAKRASGAFCVVGKTAANTEALQALTSTIKSISLGLGLLYFILLAPLGLGGFLESLGSLSNSDSFRMWVLCVASSAIGIAYGQSNNILRGLNLISIANKHVVVGYLLQLGCALTMALSGWGIFSLALCGVVGPIVVEWQGQYWLKENGYKPSLLIDLEIVRSLAPNGLRMAGVYLGGYIFTQAITVSAAQKLSLESAAKFGLSFQIFKIISTVAGVFAQNRAPIMTGSIIANDKVALLRNFRVSFIIGLACIIVCSFGLCFVGDPLLRLVGSNTQLLSGFAMGLLIVLKLVEYISDQFTTLVVASNQIPFVLPSILSGLLLYFLMNRIEYLTESLSLFLAVLVFLLLRASHSVLIGLKFIRSK